MDGSCSKKLAKLIFKARSQTLDIKTQRKWKYADITCFGCNIREESGNEILTCEILNPENRRAENPLKYSDFFSTNISETVKVAKMIENGLKQREQILERRIQG